MGRIANMPRAPSPLSIARGLRIVGVVGIFGIYFAGLTVSYLAASRLDIKLSPPWLYPVVVVGLVIVGSLGVIASTLERGSRLYPWILVAIGSVIQVAFGLVISASALSVRSIALVTLPPLTAALSLAEFARQLRALFSHAEPH